MLAYSDDMSDRIAVIGGGVAGVTTAYALARRGRRVTLIERRPYAAMETSFANGGQLSASNAEVWNRLGTVAKGIKWMMRPDAPLLVNPKPTWAKLSWMAEFLRNIPRYESNTVTTVRLAIEARRHLTRIAEEEGIAFDREDRGILHFYETKAGFDRAAAVSKLLAEGGLERRAVTPAEMRGIEPALTGDFYGGFHTPSDFSGDVHKFTTGLAEACARRGVEMRMETEITGLKARSGAVFVSSRRTGETDVRTDRFGAVVVSGGVASRRMAAMLGDRVPVYPVKGYSITVALHGEADREAAPRTGLLDDDAKIVASRLGPDRYRVAGTAEYNGENLDIREARIRPLVDWVRRRHPGVSTRDVRPWAGLRPMMPDMMPRVARGRAPGVFYNTGHGHLGWTLSAATAEAMADLIETSEEAPRAAPARSVHRAFHVKAAITP